MSIKSAGMFETKIGGVAFRLRRRSTIVMARATSLMKVAGQLSADDVPTEKDVEADTAASIVTSVVKVALVEVNEGAGWVPASEFPAADIEPFADALFSAFMASGLEADPIAPSCVD